MDASDDSPSEPLAVEVRSDAWALARRYVSDQAPDLVALGFEHLGHVFVRVPDIDWDRAEVGYTIDVLVDAERTTVVHLDLFFEEPIVAFETLFEDGGIACTRLVPEDAEVDAFARLTFASTPRAGRTVRNHRVWDAAALWSDHQALVAEIGARTGSRPVSHDLATWFALQHRGQAIAGAKSIALLRLAMGLLGSVALGAALTLIWYLELLTAPGVAVMVAWLALGAGTWAVPWLRLVALVARLPLVPARDLVTDPELVSKLGDHIVHGRPAAG